MVGNITNNLDLTLGSQFTYWVKSPEITITTRFISLFSYFNKLTTKIGFLWTTSDRFNEDLKFERFYKAT